MALPDQLLLSDLLRRRVRCDRGEDHGPGCLVWMHPPVHRVLGWISRPSAFGPQRLAWRLDQLCGLGETEVLVRGEGAPTDQATIERLPTLVEAALIGQDGSRLGHLADAAIALRTGRILHYLVSRSDPRLPGSSRWRLTPDRILDQEPGRVCTALETLDALPLARASVRQDFLRRSRRWREQLDQETGRWRDQFQQVGDRLEDRLEGWLEEPPWGQEAPDHEPPSRRESRAADPLFDDWADDGDDGSADGSAWGGSDRERFASRTSGSFEMDEDPSDLRGRRVPRQAPRHEEHAEADDPWI